MLFAKTVEEAEACHRALVRATQDERFRNRLLSDPRAVMQELGVDVPADIELRPVASTPNEVYVVLPPAPEEGEVSDAELAGVSGGMSPLFAVANVSSAVMGVGLGAAVTNTTPKS